MKNIKKQWFIQGTTLDPRRTKEALLCLKKATFDFKEVWRNNKKAHSDFTALMRLPGEKNPTHNGNDWLNRLATFGYCSLNRRGLIELTIAGEDLLTYSPDPLGAKRYTNPPQPYLDFHIPTTLLDGAHVIFDPEFDIHPIKFLIELCMSSRLDGRITDDEVLYFAIKAKKDSDLDDIVRQIAEYRKLRLKHLQSPSTKQEDELFFTKLYGFKSPQEMKTYRRKNLKTAHCFIQLAHQTGLAPCAFRGNFLNIHFYGAGKDVLQAGIALGLRVA